ncbi:MAG: response regulator [Cyclobacteriaceae bacterium]
MAETTILLIDDDDDDREIFRIALKQANEEAVLVTSRGGREALEVLSKGALQPDYIFLDINMPVMTGKDCLREIRKLDQLKNVPIFMYTTSTHVSDREVYLSMGAREILNKPLRITDLANMLKGLLEK